MTYPKGAWSEPEAHLLFDLGYSYGLLMRAEEMFKKGISVQGIEILLEDLQSFREGRLSIRDEIYDAAHKLALKGKLNSN